MKTKRAIGFELRRLTEEQLIILGHLTYHAGKLWNQANYLVQNRLAKPYYKNLYHKLKDADVNGARNILRKFRRMVWSSDRLKEDSKNKALQTKRYLRIPAICRDRSTWQVNLPRGISCQTPRGAPSVSGGLVH